MCNHQPGNEWIALTTENNMLTVTSNYDLNPGDEIFGNYGEKSNEILLYAYGFCIPGNPFDNINLKLDTIFDRSDNYHSSSTTYYISRGEGLSGIPNVFLFFLLQIYAFRNYGNKYRNI